MKNYEKMQNVKISNPFQAEKPKNSSLTLEKPAPNCYNIGENPKTKGGKAYEKPSGKRYISPAFT